MPDDAIGKIQRQIEDAQRWPLMTTQVDTASLDRSPAGGRGGGTAVSQTIDAALRDVLRWRPRAGDSKGFVAALNRAFEPFEVDGHTEWKWTPRTFAAQADMGALTGAQASLYARTRMAIDEALPLLDGLSPLQDSDDEDLAATKSIIRYELSEIGKELGEVGGPRSARVDSLFRMLLGSVNSNDYTNSAQVGGQIGQLRDRSGLNKDSVNTIDEEENLTNFMVLVGYVGGLRQSWEAEKAFFDRQGTDVFLGTQLMLLSRDLENLAGSVEECEFAMDSVFLTEAERQNIELEDQDHRPAGITVAELLNWIEDFATNEGPQLIQDGGKDGVIAIRSTLETLSSLVDDLMIRQESNPVPKGFVTPRVQARLEELSLQLHTALGHAEKVKRFEPTVDWLKKSELDGSIEVWVFGSKFINLPSVALVQVRSNEGVVEADSLLADEVQFVSPTTLRTAFSKNKVAKLSGEVRLGVRNPNGGFADIEFSDDGGGSGTTGTGTGPVGGNDLAIRSVEPASAPSGTEVVIRVTGMGFTPNTDVELVGEKESLQSSSVILGDSDGTSFLIATFDLSSATPGPFALVLEEGGDQASIGFDITSVMVEAMTVPLGITDVTTPEAGRPWIQRLRDSSATSGDGGVGLTIIGMNFTEPASVNFTKGANLSIPVEIVREVTPTKIEARLDLTDAEPGKWSVTVTCGSETSNIRLFRVDNPPAARI